VPAILFRAGEAARAGRVERLDEMIQPKEEVVQLTSRLVGGCVQSGVSEASRNNFADALFRGERANRLVAKKMLSGRTMSASSSDMA